MAKLKTNHTEVIEVEEIPLEETINNTLQKNNVTEAIISGLKKKYGGLKLRDIDDKETYLEISEARKDVRKYGILAEKLCKAGRQDAIKIQKLWLSKESEVLGKIAEVQDPLDAEIKRYEDEQERKETEAAKLREETAIQRQQTLTKMGAVYQDGSFVLNNVSFDLSVIKESDQDIWQNSILAKYVVQYEKNEAIRIESDRQKAEQEEKLRKEKEEFEKQQKQFREQQEAFHNQQQEAQRQEQLRQDAIRRENEEAERKVRLQLESRSKERSNQLQALGMSFYFNINSYVYQDVTVHNNEISSKTPDEWSNLIENITPVIEDRKADAEVKRLEEVKRREKEISDKAIAYEQERQRKIAADLEEKRLKEEEANRIKMEQASDKMKWDHFIVQLVELKFPEMKNVSYKNKVQEAKKLIDKIANL